MARARVRIAGRGAGLATLLVVLVVVSALPAGADPKWDGNGGELTGTDGGGSSGGTGGLRATFVEEAGEDRIVTPLTPTGQMIDAINDPSTSTVDIAFNGARGDASVSVMSGCETPLR